MTEPLTHASFFTGAGGLDLGLERAGWTTVSASEVDPYACALIEQRGVPNLGDIRDIDPEVIPDATLWTGGFPCQDLSKAGKRRGFGGDRSVLAFTFLDLVERRQPRWIVLENVDGLLTSNDGRDLARLLGEMDGLGYGVSGRTLDAQFFGVAQRRRRVFLVGSRGTERSRAVLFDADVRGGDPPSGRPAGSGVARDVAPGPDERRVYGLADVAGTLTFGGHGGIQPNGQDAWNDQLVIVERANPDRRGRGPGGVGGQDAEPGQGRPDEPAGPRPRHRRAGRSDVHPQIDVATDGDGRDLGPAPDASRVREVDGMAGRAHDRRGMVVTVAELAPTLQAPSTGGFRYDPDHAESLVVGLGSDGPTVPRDVVPSLRAGGNGQGDTVPIVAFRKATKPQTDEDPERWEPTDVIDTLSPMTVGATVILEPPGGEDPLLPLGLDTNRYRMTGNGVVAPVAEWIGRQLRAEIERDER